MSMKFSLENLRKQLKTAQLNRHRQNQDQFSEVHEILLVPRHNPQVFFSVIFHVYRSRWVSKLGSIRTDYFDGLQKLGLFTLVKSVSLRLGITQNSDIN